MKEELGRQKQGQGNTDTCFKAQTCFPGSGSETAAARVLLSETLVSRGNPDAVNVSHLLTKGERVISRVKGKPLHFSSPLILVSVLQRFHLRINLQHFFICKQFGQIRCHVCFSEVGTRSLFRYTSHACTDSSKRTYAITPLKIRLGVSQFVSISISYSVITDFAL